MLAPIFSRKGESISCRGFLISPLLLLELQQPSQLILAHNILPGDAVNISSVVGSIGNALNNTSSIAAGGTTGSTIVVPIDTTSLVYVQGGYVWNRVQEWAGTANYKRVYLLVLLAICIN